MNEIVDQRIKDLARFRRDFLIAISTVAIEDAFSRTQDWAFLLSDVTHARGHAYLRSGGSLIAQTLGSDLLSAEDSRRWHRSATPLSVYDFYAQFAAFM